MCFIHCIPECETVAILATNTHITMLENLLHVNALCVEDRLFGTVLFGDLIQQAARDAFGLHDDGILCLSHQQ